MTALELYNSTSNLSNASKTMFTDEDGTYVRFGATSNGLVYFETALMLDLSQRCESMTFDVRISDYSTFSGGANLFYIRYKSLSDSSKRNASLWATTSFVERNVAVTQGTETIYGFTIPAASSEPGCYVDIRSVTFNALTGIEKHEFVDPYPSASYNNGAVNADLDVYRVLMQFDGTVPSTQSTTTDGYNYFRYVVDHVLINGQNINYLATNLTNMYMFDASHNWFIFWYPGAKVGNLDSTAYFSAPTFELIPGTWLCPGHVAQGAFMKFNRSTNMWEKDINNYDVPIYTVSDVKPAGTISLGTSENTFAFFDFNSKLEGSFGFRLNFTMSDISKLGETIHICQNQWTGGYQFVINSSNVYVLDNSTAYAVAAHGMANGVPCSIGFYVINLDNGFVKLAITVNGVLKKQHITTQAADVGGSILWYSNNFNQDEFGVVSNDTSSYDAALEMFGRRYLGGLDISTADGGTGLCTSSGSYAAAKAFYNTTLTDNQRAAFPTVKPAAYQRLAAWAAANGDTFNGSHLLVSSGSSSIHRATGGNNNNVALIITVAVSCCMISLIGVLLYSHKRKHN